jgi:hypothetical protein
MFFAIYLYGNVDGSFACHNMLDLFAVG